MPYTLGDKTPFFWVISKQGVARGNATHLCIDSTEQSKTYVTLDRTAAIKLRDAINAWLETYPNE